jgi:hypothetical protein
MFVAKFYDGVAPAPHPEKGQAEAAELGALVSAKVGAGVWGGGRPLGPGARVGGREQGGPPTPTPHRPNPQIPPFSPAPPTAHALSQPPPPSNPP